MGDWHKADISEVALELGTDVKSGRMNIDSSRSRKHNNNVFVLPNTDAKSIVRHMASDASLVLLAVTYLLASLLGYAYESVVGIVFVALFFVIGSSIKYRSEMRITNSYRMLLPSAKVTENGQSYRLSVFDVEVGDLITFTQGDIIPADARLVSSMNLTVAERIIDESIGKSLYKRFDKNCDAIIDDLDSLARYDNMVYAGSMVVSGKGSAIVTEIGNDTVTARIHSGISFIPHDDKPGFLHDFNKSTKRFSLIALFCVIPVALLGLFSQTLDSSNENNYDLLYMFLLSVALATTCMSELVAAPAEALITKEILPSSRVKKNDRIQQSRITKLSSAESLAEVDTFLILSPDILKDKKTLVRRVYFADRGYRFDALNSKELNDFASQIYPFYASMSQSLMTGDCKVIKSYLDSLVKQKHVAVLHPKYLRNYPIEGARSCVFEFDNKLPTCYISRSDDIIMLRKCGFFRTEGGGIWEIDNNVIDRITDYFNACIRDGLNAYIYISRENSVDKPIFEGIVALGEEFPYADGYLSEDFFESGILPILVLESENESNINFALKCGLVKDINEIAIASDYSQAGLKIIDASLTTRVYIGFGRAGTEQLVQRLYTNGRKLLPIIKDSANRRAITPNAVFATHQLESFDSVKIASSLNLKPADSHTRSGGLSDALKAVRASAIARLKLGVYKNYLFFSSFVRITSVSIPMLLGKNSYLMTTLMVLLSGFICDYLALLVIMHTKRIAVRPKDTLSEAKKLFSPSLALFSAVGAFCSSLASLVICRILVSLNKLTHTAAPTFIMISCIVILLISCGGFVVVLKKRTRSGGINFTYYLILALGVCLLFLQKAIPDSLLNWLGKIGFSQISDAVFPYFLIPAAIALVSIVLIIGSMATFASSK